MTENNQKNLLSLAWELGYTIAVPLVLFALLGRWADRRWDTSPLLFLTGVVLAILISSYIVYKKMKDVIS